MDWNTIAVAALSGGGVVGLGSWLIQFLSKRHEWAAQSDERTVSAWKDYAKKKDEDISQVRKELSTLNADYTERMRKAEERIDREVKRRYRCEKRVSTVELSLENLEYAVDRFNEGVLPGQPKVTYRKHVKEDVDDDSQYGDEQVRPHGPNEGGQPNEQH